MDCWAAGTLSEKVGDKLFRWKKVVKILRKGKTKTF